jgi:hypothetical protein
MAKLKDLKITIGLSKAGLTKLNSDLRSTKANFNRNFGEISRLAGQAAMAITATLGAGLTALIQQGSKLQQLKVGFRSIMGGADQAAAMVDKLNKFTASTPFQLEQVSVAARQLIAVGVGVDDVTDRMGMLGDIAAASGNSIEDIAAIYAKVQAKGKVELENLNQLAERGIPIFDQLRQVTGDANMEFGAGSVKVSEFNLALQQMAEDGGIAHDAMANLSETVDGRLSTAMDNFNLALGEFAENSGLLDSIADQLELATLTINRYTTNNDDANASMRESEELLKKVEQAHMGNAEALLNEADAAKTAAVKLDLMLGTEESALAVAKATEVADAAWLKYMDSLTAFPGLPDAPPGFGVDTGTGTGTGDTDDSAARRKRRDERKKAFIERFNESARLREAEQGLAEATFQHITTAEGMIEVQQMLRDAYGEVGGAIEEITMDEEQPIFDPDDIEHIKYGTRLLEKAAFAAENIGKAFDITSQLTEAAFNNIKDKSQGFHLVIKQMLEDLLKKAIALAAAFAAIAIFTGGAGVKALGGFKKFMLEGLGIPQLAEGGLFTGASLAMVGEGPGTSLSNPEVVAPLDKLQSMMGGGNVTVTGRLDGRDILISSERANIDRNRIRGF